MSFLPSLFRPRQHTVTVTIYGNDVEFGRRRELRNAVVAALEQAALGEYVGGGTMTTDDPNYNIEFRVTKDFRALAVIGDTLRSLGAGPATELRVGSSAPQRLYGNA